MHRRRWQEGEEYRPNGGTEGDEEEAKFEEQSWRDDEEHSFDEGEENGSSSYNEDEDDEEDEDDDQVGKPHGRRHGKPRRWTKQWRRASDEEMNGPASPFVLDLSIQPEELENEKENDLRSARNAPMPKPLGKPRENDDDGVDEEVVVDQFLQELSVYIQMEEYNMSQDDWDVTHRWNYGLEQEWSRMTHEWMPARLPRVSLSSLAELRYLLTGEEAGAVILLDLPATDFEQVMKRALQLIPEKRAIKELLRARKRLYNEIDQAQEEGVTYVEGDDLLLPDLDQEAFHIMCANVPDISNRIVIFIRLADAIDNQVEKQIPVRFLMLIIGPEHDRGRCIGLCTAAAGVMSDADFVREALTQDIFGFRDALYSAMEQLVIAPTLQLENWFHPRNMDTSSQLGDSAGNSNSNTAIETQRSMNRSERPGLTTSTRSLKRNKPRNSIVSATELGSTRRQLFIAMDELVDNQEWVNTRRWNFGLEEGRDLDAGGVWEKPRLPTISVLAVVQLRTALNEGNILFDLSPRPASTPNGPVEPALAMRCIVNQVFLRMLEANRLSEADKRAVPVILTSRILTPGTSGGVRERDRPGLTPYYSALSPSHAQESFLIMVGTLELSRPLVAFVRLTSAVDLGVERGAPVRFLFFMILPSLPRRSRRRHIRTAQARALGKAFADVMCDEELMQQSRKCTSAARFLSHLDERLKSLSIVPRSVTSINPELLEEPAMTRYHDRFLAQQKRQIKRVLDHNRKRELARGGRTNGVQQGNDGRRDGCLQRYFGIGTKPKVSGDYPHLSSAHDRRPRFLSPKSSFSTTTSATSTEADGEDDDGSLKRGSSPTPGGGPRLVPVIDDEDDGDGHENENEPESKTRSHSMSSSSGLTDDTASYSQLGPTETPKISLKDRRKLLASTGQQRESDAIELNKLLSSSPPSLLGTNYGSEEDLDTQEEDDFPIEYFFVRKRRNQLEQQRKQITRWKDRQRPTLTEGASLKHIMDFLYKYSIPLILGVFIALLLANLVPDWYEFYLGGSIFEDHFCLGTGALVTNVTKRFEENSIEALWGTPDCRRIFGVEFTFQNIVNEMFMCLFFALATAELKEAFLPGGSLNPISNARSALLASAGSIVAPVICYLTTLLVMNQAGRFDEIGYDLNDAINGWLCTTLTCVPLAWMVALFVFGKGHPAVEYVLLVGVISQGFGILGITLGISAFNISNASRELIDVIIPEWGSVMLLAAILITIIMHYALHVNHYGPYLLFPGLLAWVGMTLLTIYPAFALVPVVIFMPTYRMRPILPDLVAYSKVWFNMTFGRMGEVGDAFSNPRFSVMRRSVRAELRDPLVEVDNEEDEEFGNDDDEDGVSKRDRRRRKHGRNKIRGTERRDSPHSTVSDRRRSSNAVTRRRRVQRQTELGALQSFVYHFEVPVMYGLFFFGLVNAGVNLGLSRDDDSDFTLDLPFPAFVGIIFSLLIGKPLGVTVFALIGHRNGFAPLPIGIRKRDIPMIGLICSITLTLALIVADLALGDRSDVLINETKVAIIFQAAFSTCLALVIGKTFGFRVKFQFRKRKFTEVLQTSVQAYNFMIDPDTFKSDSDGDGDAGLSESRRFGFEDMYDEGSADNLYNAGPRREEYEDRPYVPDPAIAIAEHLERRLRRRQLKSQKYHEQVALELERQRIEEEEKRAALAELAEADSAEGDNSRRGIFGSRMFGSKATSRNAGTNVSTNSSKTSRTTRAAGTNVSGFTAASSKSFRIRKSRRQDGGDSNRYSQQSNRSAPSRVENRPVGAGLEDPEDVSTASGARDIASRQSRFSSGVTPQFDELEEARGENADEFSDEEEEEEVVEEYVEEEKEDYPDEDEEHEEEGKNGSRKSTTLRRSLFNRKSRRSTGKSTRSSKRAKSARAGNFFGSLGAFVKDVTDALITSGQPRDDVRKDLVVLNRNVLPEPQVEEEQDDTELEDPGRQDEDTNDPTPDPGDEQDENNQKRDE